MSCFTSPYHIFSCLLAIDYSINCSLYNYKLSYNFLGELKLVNLDILIWYGVNGNDIFYVAATTYHKSKTSNKNYQV